MKELFIIFMTVAGFYAGMRYHEECYPDAKPQPESVAPKATPKSSN